MTEYWRAYRERNKAKVAEQQRAYYARNKAKVNEQKRAYYERNKAKVNEQKRAYYERNKAKVAEQRLAYRERVVAVQGKQLPRPQRCPTCRGLITQWPCLLCTVRVAQANAGANRAT